MNRIFCHFGPFDHNLENQNFEKSHTCEEGGANLRISVRHLSIYLKKKLLKKLLKWANKKHKNFNNYNVAF